MLIIDETLPFTEPKVLDLWNLMQEGNFTDEEKESLEEELRHFETRIEKHRHFRYFEIKILICNCY